VCDNITILDLNPLLIYLSNIGTIKPNVLPLPALKLTTQSLPDIIIGIEYYYAILGYKNPYPKIDYNN
jgi:hypothetical protein